MIESIQWLVTLELAALAFLPLSTWLMGRLPDRGFTFARILALCGITYVTWIAGSFVGIAGTWLLPVVVALAVGAAGWSVRGSATIRDLRSVAGVVMLQEALFLLAFVAWSILRAQVLHPAAFHTEQSMDMALLTSSMHASSYPPPDPWMSGHTINYYYLGYLMFGLLSRCSGVALPVGYNLALSTIAACTLVGAFSLGYTLTRNLRWSAVAAAFVGLLGNWHGVLVQLPSGKSPAPGNFWFWDSTRVISSAADYTINEFPFFSFLLGDLHPHVMALPVTLLAIAICLTICMDERYLHLRVDAGSIGRMAIPAVTIGSLFTMNSWDFPTYLGLAIVALGVCAYLTDESADWWKLVVRPAPILVVASFVLYLPFYAHFHSLAHGVGTVNTPSNLFQFLQVSGFFLIGGALLAGGLLLLLQPADADPDADAAGLERATVVGEATLEAGESTAGGWQIPAAIVVFILVLLGVRFGLWVFVLLLIVAGIASLALHRVLNAESPDRADAAALILLILGCGVAALPEIIYVRDSFDGGASYRMNTVFKFYYQAWVLLGLSGAYGFYRAWSIVSRFAAHAAGWAVIAVLFAGGAIGGYYTMMAPSTASIGGTAYNLDGAAWLHTEHPDDFAAITWMNAHVPPGVAHIEAVGDPSRGQPYGDEYNAEFARFATFTPSPAVMGWEGHESQWRGGDPEISARSADVHTIYTSNDASTAKQLLRKYHVRYVIVGETERFVYGRSPAALAKFARFMKVAFRSGNTTIYTW